jgi:phosphoribosylglycinamide formyltransferase-1
MVKLTQKLKLGVLISGRGSNLGALLAAAQDLAYPAEIALVIANRPQAPGIQLAAAAGLSVNVIDHKALADRAVFEGELDAALRAAGIELICLAGFMRVLSPEFVQQWQGRIINIHPSLLPAYKGLHVHERVLAAGETETGCTVHYVDAELDAGAIILQRSVPVLPGDTPDSLAARVLVQEHLCYPEAVRLLAEKALAEKRETVQ